MSQLLSDCVKSLDDQADLIKSKEKYIEHTSNAKQLKEEINLVDYLEKYKRKTKLT